MNTPKEEGEHANPSYKKYHENDCCYYWGNTKETPCWGQVKGVDEQCTEDYSDCWDVYACEGHEIIFSLDNSKDYKHERD